jgi:LPS sulfotransferase NodH
MSTQWQEIFESITASEAKQKYCIAFTARSGSTWLGNLIHQTGILGIPQEWFNPGAAKNTVEASACRNIPQYYRYLKVARKNADVFAMELPWPQAQLVFDAGHPNLFDDIQHWFFLKWRDYVALVVSLYKAVGSGHFHSTQVIATL